MLTHRSTRRAAVLALAALSTLAVAGCGDDDDGGDVSATEPTEASTLPTVTTPSMPEETGTTLTATLSPGEEVPGPGVQDGTGTAELKINGDEVCYDLKATMGEQPTAAHVHQGAKGAKGPVVVDLKPAFEMGESAFLSVACTTPAAGEAAKILGDPAAFYVNVHTAEHPDGAIRGQLATPGQPSY
jgi:hypothetical protein